MGFKWINKKTVQSDDGFIVQFSGRFGAEYREGDKLITFTVDNGALGSRPCISIKSNVFNHWTNNPEPISMEKQLQIMKNFREAVEFQGLALVVW